MRRIKRESRAKNRSLINYATAGLLVMCFVGLAGCTNTADPGATNTSANSRASTNGVGPSDSGSNDNGETPSPTGAEPVVTRVSDEEWQSIVDTGTWRSGCPAGQKQLRRVDINFVDFGGNTQRGALIVNEDTVNDITEIFTELYDKRFPIERMEPVEKYGGDVLESLKANNTSAFNCRKIGQINAPVTTSPHANGRAIDINPVQNPWMDLRCKCWSPSAEFSQTETGPGIIRKNSLPYKLFTKRGWIWQNISVPDYMHFDTGYPSRPRANKR